MKIYLAGPMRGIPGFNFPAFMAAAADLELEGHDVFNPAQHDIDNGFTFEGTTGNEDLSALGFSLRKALGDDLEWICQEADAVALLPGWQDSRGARAEEATARALGLTVFEIEPRPRCACGSLTLETTVSERHDRGLHGPDRCPGALTFDQPVGEVRVVNPTTGGAKGSKPARFDLIPTGPLWQVAELYGKGAEKYAPRNWERGYDWHLSFAAMMRHAWEFWGGSDRDPETGCHPLTAVIFHALALIEFGTTHPELDDRPGATPPGVAKG